jgi:indole-3-glycerol phosphate synthase
VNADFLAGMAASSRARVAQARHALPDARLRARAHHVAAPPPLVLSGSFDVIAEVKLRSPAVGQLRGAGEDVAARVARYAEAGAAAISVLTEPSRFDGELAHVTAAAQALAGRAPVMRKDFLVDPYQVYEARAAGASGVLVILRMLSTAEIEALLAAAAELSQFVLLEAFDAPDLARARALVERFGATVQLLIGVNCRDLATLQVVPERLETLAAQMPASAPRVAESGVESGADAARLAAAGYQVALVGSALMRADDPLALLRSLIAAGRAARSQRPCG